MVYKRALFVPSILFFTKYHTFIGLLPFLCHFEKNNPYFQIHRNDLEGDIGDIGDYEKGFNKKKMEKNDKKVHSCTILCADPSHRTPIEDPVLSKAEAGKPETDRIHRRIKVPAYSFFV